MRYFQSEHKHGLCVEHVHFSFGMLFRTNNSCFISSAGINDFVLYEPRSESSFNNGWALHVNLSSIFLRKVYESRMGFS